MTRKEKEAADRKERIEDTCEVLCNNMKDWREERNMTQTDVADGIGKTQGELSRYENNEAKVPVSVMLGYSDFLKVSVGELLGEQTEIEITEGDIIAEYRKLSERMQYYVYQMLRELNKR